MRRPCTCRTAREQCYRRRGARWQGGARGGVRLPLQVAASCGGWRVHAHDALEHEAHDAADHGAQRHVVRRQLLRVDDGRTVALARRAARVAGVSTGAPRRGRHPNCQCAQLCAAGVAPRSAGEAALPSRVDRAYHGCGLLAAAHARRPTGSAIMGMFCDNVAWMAAPCTCGQLGVSSCLMQLSSEKHKTLVF